MCRFLKLLMMQTTGKLRGGSDGRKPGTLPSFSRLFIIKTRCVSQLPNLQQQLHQIIRQHASRCGNGVDAQQVLVMISIQFAILEVRPQAVFSLHNSPARPTHSTSPAGVSCKTYLRHTPRAIPDYPTITAVDSVGSGFKDCKLSSLMV